MSVHYYTHHDRNRSYNTHLHNKSCNDYCHTTTYKTRTLTSSLVSSIRTFNHVLGHTAV